MHAHAHTHAYTCVGVGMREQVAWNRRNTSSVKGLPSHKVPQRLIVSQFNARILDYKTINKSSWGACLFVHQTSVGYTMHILHDNHN